MTKINKSYKKNKKKKVSQKIFLNKKGGMGLVSFLKNHTIEVLGKSKEVKKNFNISKNADRAAYILGGFMSGFGIGKGSTDEERIKNLINTNSEELQKQISRQAFAGTQEVKDEIYRVSSKSREILKTINTNFLCLPSTDQVEGFITKSRETLSDSLGQKLESITTDQQGIKEQLQVVKGIAEDVKGLVANRSQPPSKGLMERIEEIKLRFQGENQEIKLRHEQEKQMYLLAPLIGIPVIIGCLKLYKDLKKKAKKSSPRRSPTLRGSPNYKKSAKKNFDQSISASEAERLLKQLEDPFYKLYNPSFVDQLFGLLNKIIDSDYLFYGLLGILTILFFYINIYKSSKKSSLMPYFISKFFIGS